MDAKDALKYEEITKKIREIAGNMNLSNIFYGGFKTQIRDDADLDDYKAKIFDIVEGNYKNGIVEFKIDSTGIIKEITIKEE